MDKKLKKNLIVISFLCLVSLGTIVLSTIAWFANNRNVDSGGMKVQSEVVPNLVIVKDPGEFKNVSLAAEKYFLISFETGDSKKLIPSTHDWNVGTATGLKFNSNPREVSVATGLKRRENEIAFAAVPVEQLGAQKHYYVDYVAYIASKDAPLPTSGLVANSLEATVVGADGNETNNSISNYLKALSVDFYVGDVAVGNYKGTLNLAKQDYTNTSPPREVTSVPLTTTKIPQISELDNPGADTYIMVTMRVYFDGGLREVEQGAYKQSTYIRSSQIDLSGLKIKVGFEAPEQTSNG